MKGTSEVKVGAVALGALAIFMAIIIQHIEVIDMDTSTKCQSVRAVIHLIS